MRKMAILCCVAALNGYASAAGYSLALIHLLQAQIEHVPLPQAFQNEIIAHFAPLGVEGTEAAAEANLLDPERVALDAIEELAAEPAMLRRPGAVEEPARRDIEHQPAQHTARRTLDSATCNRRPSADQAHRRRETGKRSRE